MDGVSDDFSGLPEPKANAGHETRRSEAGRETPRRGRGRRRIARIVALGGFLLVLLVVFLALIVLFAPTPYLAVNHGALAQSVDGSSAQGCRPDRSAWNCWKGEGADAVRYRVEVDWSGCWTGDLIGRGTGAGAAAAQPKISGCVTVIDHLRAD